MLISKFEQQVLDDILVSSTQQSLNFTKVCWWNDNVMLVKDATSYNDVVSTEVSRKGVGV